MGQGVFTALPMILAEEAEIDFSRIAVVQADNADGTGGSGSVWEGYIPTSFAGVSSRTPARTPSRQGPTSMARSPIPRV
jgi:isoquinoline 1-oxidoreductase beta subunit